MLFDELHSSSPPPPAYELTEQEYDQKVSVVVERSRVEASSSAVARQDDELWEIWDEAAFEAAAARTTVSNSSSSAQTDSLTKADCNRDTGKSTDPSRRKKDPVAEDREPTPPPMFEPVGPSLDGPPYEPAAPPGSIMLTSHLIPSSLCPGSVSPAPSVHSATLRPASRSPRPSSVVSRSSFISGPRVPFNPQVAYTKRPLFDVPAEESLPRNADASALYNSAVSSHIPGRVARSTAHKSAPRQT
ncbi:hypothetical protein K474DRAFT_1142550 [Panus rudis PR-1116 ss-1]|nr:hypothetical protein K474DRAFT_1142550 [Panus rudis PR-1116 ss-1]